MPYQLLLGQLVYTSFPGMGFKTLKSADVPTEIQQAFMERVVSHYWDSDNPPRSEYQAVYLHQVTGLVYPSSYARSKPEFIPSASSRVFSRMK